VSTDAVSALYNQPLPADRRGPLYNAFSYPTKVSAESVALCIACHTMPGDRVLDPFGGSGTTGIAALLCERPTPKMMAMATAIGVEPAWGRRGAVVCDISEIGSLLARVMTSPPEPAAFAAAASRVLHAAEAAAPDLYATTGPRGEPGLIRHIIWSDVVSCPACGNINTYAEVRVRYGPLRFAEQNTCACGYSGHPDDWARLTDEHPDPWTGTAASRRRRVPWRVYGRSGGKNWSRPATSADSRAENESASRPAPAGPIALLRWGDLYRSGYHRGMTHLHHLYTARNFRALATLWGCIENEPGGLRDSLRLLVLSYNAAHSTLMTRVVLKKNSKDFILTGAQSGVLYVSGLPVEKNVFAGVQRKIGTFKSAFELVHGTQGTVEVVTGSSTHLDLPDESIDYIFTDPPFGANIPYSEVNQANELWLRQPTDNAEEAIVSPAQGKRLSTYQSLLTSIFSEVTRVMKKEAEATIVFHSAHASVWQALATSLGDAGLMVTAASVLDKTQASFKQVNGHVAVSGDPLLRVRRAAVAANEQPAPTIQELIEGIAPDSAVAEQDTKRHNERLYSQLVGTALVNGTPITLDAKHFYAARMKGTVQ